MNPPRPDRGAQILHSDDILKSQRATLRRHSTWARFHRGPRKSGQPLLKNLARYPNCVLVAGCQRSGTTMLTRVIASARGFQRFALTRDDELDAALILAGEVDVPTDRRYCFQTTYLNEKVDDYRAMGPNQKLIWMLRNPYSVVYSMVHNWTRFALTELYESCALRTTMSRRLQRSHWPWPFGPSRVEKACLAYSAKTSQIELLCEFVPPSQLMVVEYDRMVGAPATWLPRIFAFVNEPYDISYAEAVRDDSLRKADRLSDQARRLIEVHSEPVYRRCLSLAVSDTAS